MLRVVKLKRKPSQLPNSNRLEIDFLIQNHGFLPPKLRNNHEFQWTAPLFIYLIVHPKNNFRLRIWKERLTRSGDLSLLKSLWRLPVILNNPRRLNCCSWSSWFNLLRHSAKDKLLAPPHFSVSNYSYQTVDFGSLSSLSITSICSLPMQKGQSGEASWSRESCFLLSGWISFIDYCCAFMDWSLRAISAAPLPYFIYVQSHLSLSALGALVKQLRLRHGKCSVFAFLQFTHYCSAPPIFITRRCRGVTDELIWGSGLLLIDSFLPLWCHIACNYRWLHQENGWDLYLLVPFQMKERDLLFCQPLFSEQHSNVDWKSAKIIACGPLLLCSASGVHVGLSQMEGFEPGQQGQTADLSRMNVLNLLVCFCY